jgi:fido (protein-threonine AMPylation protein)
MVSTVIHLLSTELHHPILYRVGILSTLQSAIQTGLTPVDAAETFNVEGDNNDSSEWLRMTWQCLIALSYLNTQPKLTPEVIIGTHRILMHGATGQGVATGLRTIPAFANNYQFAPTNELASRLQKLCNKFEIKLAEGHTHAAQLAADLMVDFLSIHPFENGNGCMCRLLFTHVLTRCGFPFACSFTSPDNAYADYNRAVVRAQTSLDGSSRDYMYWLSLYSIGFVVRNARDFLQIGSS